MTRQYVDCLGWDAEERYVAMNGMVDFCREQSIELLCYGVLAGGFLAASYLGHEEPEMPLSNRSLVKYRLIVDEFGGWQALQELLQALAAVSSRRGV